MTNKIFLEGNNGGDNFSLATLEDGRIHLRVGHCCVYVIDHIVPVEWLTATIALAVLNADGVENAMRQVGWKQSYIDELCEKIEPNSVWDNIGMELSNETN